MSMRTICSGALRRRPAPNCCGAVAVGGSSPEVPAGYRVFVALAPDLYLQPSAVWKMGDLFAGRDWGEGKGAGGGEESKKQNGAFSRRCVCVTSRFLLGS